MLKYAITCPGQGFIRPNIISPYLKFLSTLKPILQEIDDALQDDFSRQLSSNSEAFLMKTSNAQPAILTVSYCIHEIMKRDFGLDLSLNATALLGHSLGEYTALLLGGYIDLSTAIRTVRLRGKLMENLQLSGYTMVAIMFKSDNYEYLYNESLSSGILANANAENQIVLSGPQRDIDAFIARVNSSKKKILRSTVLPVEIPFHNTVLQSIESHLQDQLQLNQALKYVPVISNVSGRITADSGDCGKRCAQNTAGNTDTGAHMAQETIRSTVRGTSRPVQYVASMETAKTMGIQSLINLGPGVVLHNINKRYNFKNYSLDTLQDMEQISNIFKSE